MLAETDATATLLPQDDVPDLPAQQEREVERPLSRDMPWETKGHVAPSGEPEWEAKTHEDDKPRRNKTRHPGRAPSHAGQCAIDLRQGRKSVGPQIERLQPAKVGRMNCVGAVG